METVQLSEKEIVSTNLRESVRDSVEQYLKILGNPDKANLYELVLEEVEEPLLRSVLESVRNNQVRTAKILGISRGTLRKKMKKYGLL